MATPDPIDPQLRAKALAKLRSSAVLVYSVEARFRPDGIPLPPNLVAAMVRSDLPNATAPHAIDFDGEHWSCTCRTAAVYHRRCPHVLAVMMVTGHA